MGIRQPSARQCFVCGVANPIGLHLRFEETAPGEVTAETTLTEQYQGYPGVVHGGIVATMLDETAGRSQMGSAAAPRFMYTARLQVRYRKTVPVGQPLRVVGRAGTSKGHMASATSYIYDAGGQLLAEAEALLIDIPGDPSSPDELEAIGWKVYP